MSRRNGSGLTGGNGVVNPAVPGGWAVRLPRTVADLLPCCCCTDIMGHTPNIDFRPTSLLPPTHKERKLTMVMIMYIAVGSRQSPGEIQRGREVEVGTHSWMDCLATESVVPWCNPL